jgi:uncharacterized protein (DUF433 family)
MARTHENDEELARRITIDPAVCNGKPTLRGKRITVRAVLEFMSAGESRREILRQYPSLEAADIDACLAFAARLMGQSFVVKKLA